jgi:hypothetical protein
VPGAPLRSCLVIPLGPTGSSSNGRVWTVFLRNGTAEMHLRQELRKGVGFGAVGTGADALSAQTNA